eukprot:365885_1
MATSETIDDNSKQLDVDDDEKKVESVELRLDTKLGQFKREFAVKDLKRLKYFENQLSGRWNTAQFITISSQDICFADTDLAQLIYYKKENKIDARHYKRDRLMFLLSACDYFAETIDAESIYSYLCSSCPPITMKELTNYQLKNEHLLNAVQKCMKHMEDRVHKMRILILKKWTKVSMDIVISSPGLAASLFVARFKTAPITKTTIKYDDLSQEYLIDTIGHTLSLLKRNVSDIHKLWKYIKQNKIYQQYPKIMHVICGINPHFSSKYPLKIKKQKLSIFAEIGADATELICLENLEAFNINKLIQNFCAICKQSSGNFLLLMKDKINKLDTQKINTTPIAIALATSSKYWFEDAMNKEAKWIINVLSCRLSLETIKPLIQTISNHIAKGNRLKPEYITFLQQYGYLK